MHIGGGGTAHGIGRVAWCRTTGYCVEAFGGARSNSLLLRIEAQDVLAPSYPLRKCLCVQGIPAVESASNHMKDFNQRAEIQIVRNNLECVTTCQTSKS